MRFSFWPRRQQLSNGSHGVVGVGVNQTNSEVSECSKQFAELSNTSKINKLVKIAARVGEFEVIYLNSER